jgi:hypothetical protein
MILFYQNSSGWKRLKYFLCNLVIENEREIYEFYFWYLSFHIEFQCTQMYNYNYSYAQYSRIPRCSNMATNCTVWLEKKRNTYIKLIDKFDNLINDLMKFITTRNTNNGAPGIRNRLPQ